MPWQEIKPEHTTVQCGYREGFPNFGQVHDPNAWVIQEFCSHAGLFSTITGLCRTMLNYQEKTGFIQLVKAEMERHQRRFCHGWDRVVDPKQTLAGLGCGPFTFGHLGFTGTSIWIDAEKMRGQVILTNAVREHWYDKQILNDLRRGLGALAWGSSISS